MSWKSRISSLERVYSAVQFEELDRVPIIPLLSYALSDLIGCSIYEYCHDAKRLSKAIVAGYRKFDYDAVIAFADVYLFAEAVGLKLDFPPDNVPTPKKSPIKNIESLDSLEIPDVEKDGRLPILLEAIERTSQELNDKVAIYSGGQGPFSLAAEIRGLESFLKDLYLNKTFARKLIRFTTEYMIEMGRAEVEAGAHIIHLGESFAGPSIVSPRFFKEFALPYNRQIFDKWKSLGAVTSIHICGDSSLIWPLIPETKTDIFEIDYMVDLEKAKEVFRNKTCLMGNIDPAGIIHRGSPKDNVQACKDCIKKGGNGGGYILGSGCLIMPGFPHKNLEVIVQTVKEFGKYKRKNVLIESQQQIDNT